MTQALSFPRQYARTQRFSLGAPRAFTVSPDGDRVVFLRSRSGTDRSHLLWVLDPESGAERVAADPAVLLSGAAEELSPQERARRERSREGSAGIVGYATDDAVELAAFALSGRLFTAELRAGTAREIAVPGPVVDPRPSPDGRLVAYVADGALRVVAADGGGDRVLAGPEGPDVTYGLAEFIAAEEMSRSRGYWWSPDGAGVLAARVDTSPVHRWWIADPANPGQAPAEVAYPAAGTPNAEVTLVLLTLDGTATAVEWDRERYPYLAQVHWSAAGPPLLLVQTRDQREQLYLAVDTATGGTREVHRDRDGIWLDLFAGVPAWMSGERLVRISDENGSRSLFVGEHPWTGPELHVRAMLGRDGDGILLSASAGHGAKDPEIGEIHVYRADGGPGGPVRLSDAPGVHSAVRAGAVTVLSSASPESAATAVRVLRDGERVAEIGSHSETPVLTARPALVSAGERGVPAAVLLPSGHREGDGPLPVLMDPYGGPHGQMVVSAQRGYLQAQWLADQGFAVVVADGRGTPGHSPAWEKAIAGDFAGVTLDDQVHALHALAGHYPLDLTRVGIRGWSYGGYLAALAVLRRPDVFHAAVAGAPVTDFRLYDTHYTERYLGHPEEAPAVYAANSLVTDAGLSDPADEVRPLMIIHGLADDNVVAAHTLRLSSALLAAGRPHEVLPLSGVTHMTPQEEVAENLLLLQVAFLKRSLGISRG
ncbi:prolyl oligopeptidase family serine peptidase [Actinacidiphila glaucinigra]|uniref:S9 family peptidase n=1 Tax=Actinacidiphila glaucinigra TaxID=235986 RepID=UPI002DDC518D|nr:prolyl oligopeptidase family serine peptidase [Actinacidiphila glaucinigra]WSD60320.1 prolyl oligopeptidase family serine peptidase [Actinacidiphila glaucinigra]